MDVCLFSNPSKFYIQSGHFTAWNKWEADASRGYLDEEACQEKNRAKFIVDKTTGDRYLNEPSWIIRLKCAGIALLSIPIHLGYAPVHCINITVQASRNPDEKLSHTIARIAMTPLTVLALFFSALYGVLNPLDGRKLYATFERFHYHTSLIAECFQPSSDNHSRNQILEHPLTLKC